MSKDERVHFKIALPVELKKRLEHWSVENRRSLSAEIISRLEDSLESKSPDDGGGGPAVELEGNTVPNHLSGILTIEDGKTRTMSFDELIKRIKAVQTKK